MEKTAIVLGATGLTGGVLLELLLEDDRYHKIKLFSRSTVGKSHPKIEEHLLDLLELQKYKEAFTGDEVYCCIGTTKSKTPDEETYRKIDYGIPAAAAKLSAENGIGTFVVISAMGADPESKLFYNRTKGEMENAVLEQSIHDIYILQPGLIAGEREEKRVFEYAFKKVMEVINPFLTGSLKKYRSIPPEKIAKGMIAVANKGYHEDRIPNDEIHKIAGYA